MIRDWLWYALGVLLTPLVVARLGLTPPQTLAVAGFCLMLYGAIFFWKFRLAFASCGIALLLSLNLLDIPHLVEFAGLDIIFFLIAMMTVIGFLEEKHFFEHLIDAMLLRVGPHPKRILVLMMIFACVAAALVDEVTSILFMVAAMLNLLGRSKVNPAPFILMLVFATNIGSSATVVGNPIGVLIALRSGLTFLDFIRWAMPIAVVCLAVTIPLCLKLFAKDIKALKGALSGARGEHQIEHMVEEEHGTRRGLRQAGWLFGLVILGLVLHHALEHWLGLPKNTMLLAVALLGAGVALAITGERSRELLEKRVDWITLSFFLMLFASVGTLKQMGVTGVIAQRIIALSGGSIPLLTTLFGWSAWLLTSIMDNVLAVATFIPIVHGVSQAGLQTFPLWWAMLLGGTLGGNATLVGSTANIVAAGVLERRKVGEITFGYWLKPGLVVALVTMVVALGLVLLQLPLMPHAVTAAVTTTAH